MGYGTAMKRTWIAVVTAAGVRAARATRAPSARARAAPTVSAPHHAVTTISRTATRQPSIAEAARPAMALRVAGATRDARVNEARTARVAFAEMESAKRRPARTGRGMAPSSQPTVVESARPARARPSAAATKIARAAIATMDSVSHRRRAAAPPRRCARDAIAARPRASKAD